jgi:hypothetical protein
VLISTNEEIKYKYITTKIHVRQWKRISKTKAFIQVLSRSVGIPTDLLIKYKSGSIHDRATWVHPQVAINIAQWVSPQFDVKVSGWVYEIMMTGKVDITNTTSFKELQKENLFFRYKNNSHNRELDT